MKRALHNLLNTSRILKQFLPVLLITLACLNARADCMPTVISSPTVTNICAGDSVLMACTDPTATSWQWYKDGVIIADSTKSSCYAKEAGSYTVITNECNLPSIPVIVTIKSLPNISISASSLILCRGQQVTLNVSAPNVIWVWLEPGPIIGTQTNPLIVAPTVTTSYGIVGRSMISQCPNIATITVLVDPPLVPGTLHSKSQVCPGGTPPQITSDPATGGSGSYTYQWQMSTTSSTAGFIDLGSASTTNPPASYQPGATFVTTWYRLKVSSSPCDDKFSSAVAVQVDPIPMVTSASTKAICTGSSVSYHPTSNVANATFTWNATVTSGSVSGFTPSGSGDINDVLTILPLGSPSIGEVTYTITPTGPATSFCPGTTPLKLVVTVYPIALVTNTILSQDICAGTASAPVVLQSNIPAATFSWTATGSAGLSGYPTTAQSGNIPPMTITGLLSAPGKVTITITPNVTGGTCAGTPMDYTINVNPSPSTVNSPMLQTICTGTKTSLITLASNITGTTFTWAAVMPLPSGVSGVQASGTNTIPEQMINNSSNIESTITYHIVPDAAANGCAGIPNDYTVKVNPEPIATAPQSTYTICSGNTTTIPLSSNVANTTFSWTSSAPAITGFSDGTGNVISQTLVNKSNANHSVTYIITPSSNGCAGNPITVTVTVIPEQVLTVVPANPTTCSGSNVVINLNGNVGGISFSWTASSTGNVSGFSNGSGSTISQTLTNNDNVTRTVIYEVTMTLNGCISGVTNFSVTVYPTASITNNPLSSAKCSGMPFNLALSSSVAGSTYTWIANCSTTGVTGYSGGSGSTLNQTIQNPSVTPANVIYTITPSANGCTGIPANYKLTVNPIPDVNLSLSNQSICSGTATLPVSFSSAVGGTTYSWTATPSGAGITGYTASGSALIPAQIINNTLSLQGTVTYALTPSFTGCNGNIVSHIVTINPRPLVTNASMSQTICNGATSSPVSLLSNVAGTSFTWIATPSSGLITGYTSSGSSSSIPSQSIYNTGTTPGTVTYQIIPTSNFGPNCSGTTAIYTITINPSPTITSILNSVVCSGQPFTYSITADLTGTTFTWARAAVNGISNASATGAATTISETLINTTNSDIDVQYILTPKGITPTFCPGNPVVLTVKVRALPSVSAGDDITIPFGIYTSLNGTASNGTGALSYTWTPNSYIASGANSLTPQTTNLNLNRTYSLTVYDAAGCFSSDQMTVYVVGIPVSAVPTSTPNEICVGGSATINANAIGGSGGYTYTWTSLPVGYTASSATINVSPLINTQYFVVVNDGFNTATASVTTTVNPLPLQFGLTGGGNYCTGGTGVVVGLAGSQSGVNYQLLNNGNPLGAVVPGTGASISFGNQKLSGIYTATATSVSTGCTQGMGSSVTVTINSLPTAEAGPDQLISFGTSTMLNGSVSGGFGTMNYSWNPSAFINSGVNTSTPSTTNLFSSTTFTLNVTDANGCTGSDHMVVSLDGNAISVNATSAPTQICADTSHAELNAIATGGSGSYTYSWTSIPAGSPAWTSTLQKPLVSPDVTTVYSVTANDGYNTAIASVTLVVNPLPLEYSVNGGGEYCYAGEGVGIGLSGSELNTNYQLFRGGVADGPAVTGTGNPISLGNRTAAFTYTVTATNNITGCRNQMDESATILITTPPVPYLITGGGSYPLGGPGRLVGLIFADAGISYQLYCNNLPVGIPQQGNNTSLNFGLQTQAGTYTIVATDPVTGCTSNMLASVDINILATPIAFEVTGGGAICEGEPGLQIMLSGSEDGLGYQLIFNGFPLGGLIAGTNLPLFWGPFTTSGLYEVRALNPLYGSTQMMLDSAVIISNPLPSVFKINPTGSQCPGTTIRLNGSDLGVTYYLLLNGIPVDTLAGTGSIGFLDFGPRNKTGTYTIKGVNSTTGCETMMNGSTFITIPPRIFNITPAGILCSGQVISLSGSEPGVNYQLRMNGSFDLGAPIPGTGSAIIMGNAGLPGIYSVVATSATTSCVTFMSDKATLFPDPTAFSIVPNGAACEGDIIGLNGSEPGVEYVLFLDNAIHIDTIRGTGLPINFGSQFTAGSYTIMATDQTSYCQFTMNGTTDMNDSPIKYSLLPAGIQCIGNTVSLSGSQAGVDYQLILDGLYNIGLPVAGTGNIISFGKQDLKGIYTVRAVNNNTGCNSVMINSAVFDPLPTVFTTIPAGNSHCAGTIVGLDGSETGFNYILVLDGAINLDTISGNGKAINFGAQVTAGTYSIVAYNAASFCSSPMNGNSVIEASPDKFDMTPAGNSCVGATIGLEMSVIGISYQLRWNGSINVGDPVAGTGTAISFGSHDLTGTYSVIATNSNGCTSLMSSTVKINPFPVAFNIIPSGIQCQGTPLGMDGSETNVNYILVLNGNVLLDTITGTGKSISFGPQPTSGNYSAIAYYTETSCLSAMNGTSIISKVAPTVFTMTPAGIICSGSNIGLNNSEAGAFYQLRLNGSINVGSPVTGTGSAISFGTQTISGVYTTIAINANGCNSLMTNNVIINPNPVAYTISPSGVSCPGTVIGIDGSETGVNYILVLDGSINIDTLAGNGSPIAFGIQTTSGTYTVIAYNATTLCLTMMNGNTLIKPAPVSFDMTPSGIFCTGTTIGIDDSEMGVLYQLRRNGTINIGTLVAGTGFAINFGMQSMPGTYTVEAVGGNGCVAMMNASVVINPNPSVFKEFPVGSHCSGTAITLNGSEVGMNYVLLRNGIFNIDTLAGTGKAISFGPQMISGSYMVAAFSSAASCPAIMIGSTTILAGPTAFNLTPGGIICSGSIIGLDGSQSGISYQLRQNGTSNIGSPVSGTGSAISFGTQNLDGIYTVVASDKVTGCNSIMTGTIVIEPLPVVFNTVPAGSHCAGTTIGLNGSEINFNYILVLDGTMNLDTISGTGKEIDFGAQTLTGNYSVVAYNQVSLCTLQMNGNSTIKANPYAYRMTPSGIICSGSIIGIENSETGVHYQLYRNGTFDIGNPVAGTGSAISFGIQNLQGTYSIIATNSKGCYSSMSNDVVVNPLPGTFNLIPAGIQCQGTSLGLNGSETNVNYVLVRNGIFMIDTIAGTGGMISFGPQITSGNYSVIAFYASTHCQLSMIGASTILLQSAPASFSMTPAGTYCGNANIGLDTSEYGVSYQLRLNGTVNVGNAVAGTGAAINFGNQTLPGIYTALATNSNGCTSNALNNVSVLALPTSDFNYNGGMCDSLITFSTTSSGAKIARWIWTFGDSKSKIIDAPENPDISHIYSIPGSYKVTLVTETENGCRDTITKTVLRKPCIAAAFKVSDEVVCQKRSMKFTESSTCQAPIASWTWYFGDNTSARFTNPQPFIEHTYAIAGNYNVKMVVATQMVGGLVTDTASSKVAVKPAAKALYKWQDVCVGSKTLFDNQSQDNNTIIKSYLWNFGDPASSSDTISTKQAEYTYGMHGVFDVKLVVTNTLGCTDTIINKVNIFEGPAANFTWNNSCESKPVYFTDKSQATSSAIVTWNWQFSDAGKVLDKSDDQSCAYNFVHAGTYDADMKVTDKNGCSTTLNKQVTISPNPVAAFTIVENYDNKQGQVMLSNGTLGGTNSYWDFGNGLTSHGTEPVVTFNEEGHYTIHLLTWNDQNCTDTISMSYNLMFKGLYVPNAFSPDDIDPEVAVFRPKGMNLKSYHIEIYDRWGNLLWKSDKIDDKGSPTESWDGTFKGQPLQQDAYVWKIVAKYKDGERWEGRNTGNNENLTETRAGIVTLLR